MAAVGPAGLRREQDMMDAAGKDEDRGRRDPLIWLEATMSVGTATTSVDPSGR